MQDCNVELRYFPLASRLAIADAVGCLRFYELSESELKDAVSSLYVAPSYT
jgi:hypothetical protein